MSSSLNVNAAEWQPTGATPYTDGFALPASTEDTREQANNNNSNNTNNATPVKTAAASHFNVNSPAFVPQGAAGVSGSGNPYMNVANAGRGGEEGETGEGGIPEYLPTFMLNGGYSSSYNGTGLNLDWSEEFEKVMELTGKMIREQLEGTNEEGEHPPSGAAAAAATGSSSSGAEGKKPTASQNNTNTYAAVAAKGTSHAKSPQLQAKSSHHGSDKHEDKNQPPLTANGNRRWKRPTKAQQKREQSQKGAFEAFAATLLHSLSPYMTPLRALCQSSLPHLKLDQRFGKSGQPQTAIAQFIVAPLISTYRPRHYHDLSPGDLLEYHFELYLILTRGLLAPQTIIIGYGPTWKRYAIPYSYIVCSDYAKEIRRLCPEEIPNSRAEAIYESDVVKDITEVILAVEELEFLAHTSILDAMKRRMNLSPLYDAFNTIFEPIENYTIEITNLAAVPSTFLLKASTTELAQKPQPLVLYGDPELWEELPVVSRVVVQREDPRRQADNPTAAASSSNVNTTTTSSTTTTSHSKKSLKKGNSKKKTNNGLSWQVLLPVVVSVSCVLTTVAVVLLKERQKK